MNAAITRGSVWVARLPPPVGTRPVVVLTRDAAIPLLTNVVVAEITRTVHGLRTEVELGKLEGLDHECAVNCDNLNLIPKASLRKWIGELGPEKLVELGRAVRTALDL